MLVTLIILQVYTTLEFNKNARNMLNFGNVEKRRFFAVGGATYPTSYLGFALYLRGNHHETKGET